MPGNSGLEIAIKFQSLPVNSEFKFVGTVGVKYANERAGRVITDDCVFSGYDMSTVGFQTVTVSYLDQYGITLTTQYTLHVFGSSTWRNIWNGNSKVNLKDAKYYVNNVESLLNSGQRAVSCPIDNGIFQQYVGTTSPRTLRVSYRIDNQGRTNELYILGQSQSVPSGGQSAGGTVTGTFDYSTQQEGTIDSGGANYGNVYKTIAVNNYGSATIGGDKNQMIVGQIDPGYTDEYGFNLIE